MSLYSTFDSLQHSQDILGRNFQAIKISLQKCENWGREVEFINSRLRVVQSMACKEMDLKSILQPIEESKRQFQLLHQAFRQQITLTEELNLRIAALESKASEQENLLIQSRASVSQMQLTLTKKDQQLEEKLFKLETDAQEERSLSRQCVTDLNFRLGNQVERAGLFEEKLKLIEEVNLADLTTKCRSLLSQIEAVSNSFQCSQRMQDQIINNLKQSLQQVKKIQPNKSALPVMPSLPAVPVVTIFQTKSAPNYTGQFRQLHQRVDQLFNKVTELGQMRHGEQQIEKLKKRVQQFDSKASQLESSVKQHQNEIASLKKKYNQLGRKRLATEEDPSKRERELMARELVRLKGLIEGQIVKTAKNSQQIARQQHQLSRKLNAQASELERLKNSNQIWSFKNMILGKLQKLQQVDQSLQSKHSELKTACLALDKMCSQNCERTKEVTLFATELEKSIQLQLSRKIEREELFEIEKSMLTRLDSLVGEVITKFAEKGETKAALVYLQQKINELMEALARREDVIAEVIESRNNLSQVVTERRQPQENRRNWNGFPSREVRVKRWKPKDGFKIKRVQSFAEITRRDQQ